MRLLLARKFEGMCASMQVCLAGRTGDHGEFCRELKKEFRLRSRRRQLRNLLEEGREE